MNPPETNDPLDALLRDETPYIEDAGFTARVVAALPRRRRNETLRQVLLLSLSAVGSSLAIRWLPWRNLPTLDSVSLISPDPQVLLPWLLVLSVVGALVWSVVAALQWED